LTDGFFLDVHISERFVERSYHIIGFFLEVQISERFVERSNHIIDLFVDVHISERFVERRLVDAGQVGARDQPQLVWARHRGSGLDRRVALRGKLTSYLLTS